ncbi:MULTISPECIES: hypothetical protein [unclassified Kitasatospora]|uniref:hypothetical protein n=1 Tax=unclassified Kitasatospora TaxID=2633591 RepID=UPI00340C9521
MWLVLCDPGDQAALWAHEGLRKRGLEPLELLSPQALLGSTRSAHRVGRHGAAFDNSLPDGRILASRDVSGVLNRVAAAPFGLLPFDTHADARYAQEELSALLLSLLTCLGPVSVNRPGATGLCGAWRSAAEWTVLAARAGLPVPPARISSSPEPEPPWDAPGSGGVLVLGEHVFGEHGFGAPAAEDEKAYVRLARLAGTDLLGLDLHRDGGQRVVFAGATPLPDLRSGGDPFLDRLLDHLTGLSGLSGPSGLSEETR